MTQEIEEAGYSYHYPVLQHRVIEANKNIAAQLQIPIASKVFEYERLRIVENVPRIVERIYMDYSLVPDIEKADLEDRSFSKYLSDQYGLVAAESEENILIVSADEEERRVLELPDQSEVMYITGKTFLKNRSKTMEYYQLTAIPGFIRFRNVSHYEH